MSASQIYGIDLGTTYSAIAYVDEHGQPVVILNEDNDPVTASAIYFETANNIIVGKVAKATGRIDPMNFVEMIKTEMGSDGYRRDFFGKDYRPEELSAIILGKMKQLAEDHSGSPVTDVVITVPAYFDEQRRNATEQAGILAGLNVKQIIPEPTAAAIFYAADSGNAAKTVLVYDLGGGTFDVTVIRIEGKEIRVVCVKGDHDLGGRRWDNEIVAYAAAKWSEESGELDDPLGDMETLQTLTYDSEEAKKNLSARARNPMSVVHGSKRVKVDITREKFDELTEGLLETTIALTRDAVAEAAYCGAPPIDLILLVGGSSRMPQVQERLQTEFPGVEIKLSDPDLAVAKGAAIYANNTRIQDTYADLVENMFGDRSAEVTPEAHAKLQEEVARALPGTTHETVDEALNTKVVNVCSKNFGVIYLKSETDEEAVSYMITRNTAVPAELKEEFYTVAPNQESVKIRVVESSAELGPNVPLSEDPNDPSCREIKSVELLLPPGLQAGHPIQITLSLSEDGGRLRIQGMDVQSGRSIEDTVSNLDAIQPEEMEDMKDHLGRIRFQ